MFGPLCMIAIELHRWLTRPRALNDGGMLQPAPTQRGLSLKERWRLTADVRRDVWRIFGIGMLLLFVYVGTDFAPEPSFVKWANTLEEGTTKDIMATVAEGLRIFPNAGNALAYQISHNIKGHGSYLLGESFPRAVWSYFPVVLSMKTTLPIMAMLLLVALSRPRALVNWAMFAAVALVLFSVTYRVQIGIRMVYPGMAMLIIGLSCAAAVAVQSWQSPKLRVALGSLFGGIAVWAVVIACLTWPHGITYINELWGGPRAGYRLLSDSNYDWGQGLPDLDDWRRAQGLEQIDLWYFGTDPRLDDPGFHSLRLHVEPVAGLDELAGRMKGGLLAVGATLLYGSYSDPVSAPVRSMLRQLTPVAQTSTFLIYRIPPASSGGRTDD